MTTNRARWGIEPICRVLPFALATYHAALARPPSARRVRDEALKPESTRVFTENRRVYGADKVWAQLRRAGTRVETLGVNAPLFLFDSRIRCATS